MRRRENSRKYSDGCVDHRRQETVTKLIRAVESGEAVVITRQGKPVAQIVVAPAGRRQPVRWGAMRNRIQLPPGWDQPIDVDRFLSGEL